MIGGMGAIQDSSGCWVMPDWCGYVPFSSYMSSCQVPTPAQLTDPRCNAGKNLNIAANANVPSAYEIACRADPSGCSQYNIANDYPNVAATFGTGVMGQSIASVANFADGLGISPLLLIGGVVLGIVLITRR